MSYTHLPLSKYNLCMESTDIWIVETDATCWFASKGDRFFVNWERCDLLVRRALHKAERSKRPNFSAVHPRRAVEFVCK